MTEHDVDGTTWHVFEDKGRKIMVKFDLEEPRREPVLPVEPESQLKFPPKRHTETQIELGQQHGQQSKTKPQSVPPSEAQHGIEDAPQPESQPETQPDPSHEQIKHVAEEVVKIKSIRDRLGVSVTYLEGLLKIRDVVKDVSRLFQTLPPTDYEYSCRSTRSLVFP